MVTLVPIILRHAIRCAGVESPPGAMALMAVPDTAKFSVSRLKQPGVELLHTETELPKEFALRLAVESDPVLAGLQLG